MLARAIRVHFNLLYSVTRTTLSGAPEREFQPFQELPVQNPHWRRRLALRPSRVRDMASHVLSSEPHPDDPTSRSLFGGAMTASLPLAWQDVSDLVPVPDNQEVFRLALPAGAGRLMAREPRVASVVVELLEPPPIPPVIPPTATDAGAVAAASADVPDSDEAGLAEARRLLAIKGEADAERLARKARYVWSDLAETNNARAEGIDAELCQSDLDAIDCMPGLSEHPKIGLIGWQLVPKVSDLWRAPRLPPHARPSLPLARAQAGVSAARAAAAAEAAASEGAPPASLKLASPCVCLKVYIAHVSLECVDSELVITLSVPFSDEAAARTAPADMRAFVDAEQGEPHDSALFGFQELLHSFRVADWSVFGDEGLEPAGTDEPEGGASASGS